MTKPLIGQRIKRNEDPRLLTGQALFVDDVQIPGMLHAAFVRSDYAHAILKGIDVSAARERPGVVAVYTWEDLGDYWEPGPPLVSPPPTVKDVEFHSRRQVPLVKDKVRHAGEAIVMVIAESRYIAEDAVDDIIVDLEPLDVIVDITKALDLNSPLVHDDLESNLAAHICQKSGDFEATREQADLIIKRQFNITRGAAAAMENRGVVADWDEKSKHITIWDTTQAPIAIRNGMAERLGLSLPQIRVIAPFLGGGFGPKMMMFYPEELLVPWVSMQLCRPVKWIEDRRENFYATTQERDQVHDAEMTLTKEGKILGIRSDFLHDTGAFDPYGLTIPLNTQCHLMGGYDISNFISDVRVVFTNKTIATPVRGAGRPQGIFVVERLLDIAAKELGMDPIEIRKKNFIPKEAFPYDREIIDQAFTTLIFDSGNYQPVFKKAMDMIEYKKFVETEQPKLHAEGKYIGIGVVPFVETTGVGPYEGARVIVETDGKVNVATGVGTQGQGHFTSFAQVVADQLGVKVSDVRIVTGDTSEFHWGTGTFASRGSVVAANAINASATLVREKILRLASEALDTPEEELELEDGMVRVADIPQQSISLGELAVLANPMRGTIEPGFEPGLEATAYFGPPYGAAAFGAQAMILEIDPETMMINIRRFVSVEDCGTMLNPLIVEGQVHGGVAFGIGNAYYEKLEYDDQGQLLNASLADYLIPTASEVPHIEVGHEETKSPLNPIGSKGVGEAGAIPVPALFAQALEDAFKDANLEILEMPLSPNRLFELLYKKENES